MNNKQFYSLDKHFTKTFSTIILVLIILVMYSCNSINNDNNTNNEISIEQDFTNECPIEASGNFDENKITIEYKNNSAKNITSLVGAIVHYDNNDKPIKGSQGNLLWGIKCNDTIAPNKSSTWEYPISVTNLAQAKIYIYYVCFSDQTTWGHDNLSETEALQYGTNFSIQRDLSKYYIGQCGLVDTDHNDESQIVETYIFLNLKNNSSQSISAYEAIIVQYDVYGNALGSSIYKTIKCQPVGFEPNKSDFHQYSCYKNASYAEVYVYYVLFQDRTSWGYREYINPIQALKYGQKFVLNRTV